MKDKKEMKVFEDLVGKTLANVENVNNERIVFTLGTGSKYMLYHNQDCCETVMVEDVIGDLNDLKRSPILMAESVSQNTNPEGVKVPEWQESFTWTFYKLATIRGYVTIRWYGSSNGYYSEGVNWSKVVD